MSLHVTPEIVIWILASSIGIVVSWLSLREISRNEESLRIQNVADKRVIRSVRKDKRSEILRGVAQVMAFIVGIIELLFSEPVQNPKPPTLADTAVLFLLVGFELVLVFKSTQDYVSNRNAIRDQMAEDASQSPVLSSPG